MTLPRRLIAAAKAGLRPFKHLTAQCWDWLCDRGAARCLPLRRVRLCLQQLEDRTVPSVTAIDDFYLVAYGQTVQGASVLANDQGFSLSASLVSQPLHGSVALNSDGTYTYTHTDLSWAGSSDTWTYQATDGVDSDIATVTEQVAQGMTSTSLSASTNWTYPGQAITFTATVSGAMMVQGAPTPSGSVVFKEGATTLATVSLDGSGSASFTTSTLGEGSHTITAEYAGSMPYSGSSNSTSVMITRVMTSTSLSASPTWIYQGQSVALSSTVTSMTPGTGAPTGSIAFKEGSTVLATVSLDVNGSASFTTANWTAGMHMIAACYTASGIFAGSNSSSASIMVSANSAPTVSAISNQSNAEGDSVSLQVSASDPELQTLTFSAAGLPSGLSINASTGLISGTIDYAAAETSNGSYSSSVSATDAYGLSDTKSFTWTVSNTNRVPILNAINDQWNAEGAAVSLQVSASDPDGNTLTYSAANLPAGLSIDPATGLISGTIGFDAAETNGGIYTSSVTATDGSASDTKTFTWTVTDTNRAPTLSAIADRADAEGDVVSLQTSASDPDGDPLTYSAANLPAGLSIDPATGLISGTIGFDAAETNGGNYTSSVTATDGSASDTKTFTWTVTDTNRAPALSAIADQSNAEGDVVSLQTSASDPDGDTVTYSASNLPTGLSINSSTGQITGTISFSAYQDAPNHDGIYSSSVTASDGLASDTKSFTWTVSNTVALSWTTTLPTFDWSQIVADPSITNPGAKSNNEGDVVSLAISASDPNNYPLTYAAVNLPEGLSINATTGVISGTVGYQSAEDFDGNYTATVIVGNDHGGVASIDFAWTVADTPRLPQLTNPDNQTNAVGSAVSLQIQASQPDNEPLFYEADGLPWGLSIDSETGLISGTIEGWTASSTPYSVTITVTDYAPATPQVATQTFNWTVTAGAASVTLTQPDNQVSAAGDFAYLPLEATDGGGYALTYTASGLPSGLSIDPGTGEIYGTIANAAASSTPYSITVTASDGQASDSKTFTWTVGAVRLDNPGDQTSLDGDTVSLQLTAANAGTGTLSWSATGLPTGLSINASTGEISGTIDNNAHSADPYAVSVTVTDGTDSSVQAFNWYVGRLALTNPGNQTNLEGATVSLQLTSTDHVNAPTYSAANLPSGLSLNATTGEISGTIAIAAYGQSPYLVTVTATDGTLTSSQSFIWSVTPQIALANPGTQTSAAGDTVSLALNANDHANGTLTYSASGLPSGLSIDASTGLISGTIAANPASYAVSVTASDGTYSSSQTFAWNVANIVLPATGDQSNLDDDSVSLSMAASYHGAGTLTYSATGLPTSLSINTSTGLISGTIADTADASGPYAVTVTATDGTDSASRSFTWNVDPRVTLETIDAQTNVPSDVVSLSVYASDAGSGSPTLTYSASGLPSGLSINSSTGVISGTITAAASSTPYSVTVTAGDGTSSVSQSFNWSLVPIVLANPGDQASVGQATINLALSATVASGYTASYSATGLPTGLSINSSTGAISGTLAAGATGNAYLVTVSATAGGVTSTHEFLWRVGTVVVTAPAQQTSSEGDAVSLQVSAGALSGTLTYSAIGLPAGLSINASTGLISGTIAAGVAGSPYYLATVIASNGTVADSQSFYWTVNPRVAVTAIDDRLNIEGDTVSLQVNASEPGATLSYSATGLPTGLGIDSATGLISGTVATGISGLFDTVVTVSDGTYSSDIEFAWTIHHANNTAPTLTNPGLQSNVVGDSVSLQIMASDADGDTLTYLASGLPDGLWIDPDSGVISGQVYEGALSPTPYDVTITVVDHNGGATTQTYQWVVNDSALAVAAASNLTATAGSATGDVVVATFTNSDPSWAWWEFTATINWGDGTQSDEGIIDGGDGNFTVTGNHVYARAGSYITSVAITDGFQTISANGAIAVSATPLTVSGGITLGAAAEIEVSGVVASFTGNKSDAAGSFTATINWGDGFITAGTVEGEDGNFVVKGAHTYALTGTYTIGVTVAGLDSVQSSAASSAQVGDLLAGVEGTLAVATFQSIDPNASVGQFSATVNWGDGTSSNSISNPDKVWITYANGVYTVHGKHTYADNSLGQAGGVYTVGVTVNGPYSESINSTSSVSVMSPAVSGYGENVAAEPNQALTNAVVAKFFDPNFSDVAGNFTAEINWGDGVTSAGQVILENGMFVVKGGHEYAAEANYEVGVLVQQALATTAVTVLNTVATALLVDAPKSPTLTYRRESLQKFADEIVAKKAKALAQVMMEKFGVDVTRVPKNLAQRTGAGLEKRDPTTKLYASVAAGSFVRFETSNVPAGEYVLQTIKKTEKVYGTDGKLLETNTVYTCEAFAIGGDGLTSIDFHAAGSGRLGEVIGGKKVARIEMTEEFTVGFGHLELGGVKFTAPADGFEIYQDNVADDKFWANLKWLAAPKKTYEVKMVITPYLWRFTDTSANQDLFVPWIGFTLWPLVLT